MVKIAEAAVTAGLEHVSFAMASASARELISGTSCSTITVEPPFDASVKKKRAGEFTPNVNPGEAALLLASSVSDGERDRHGMNPAPEEEKGRFETNLRNVRVREREHRCALVSEIGRSSAGSSCCVDEVPD